MKLALRIFALTIVIAGVAGAATTHKASHLLSSHQSATDSMPIPECVPGLPTCP